MAWSITCPQKQFEKNDYVILNFEKSHFYTTSKFFSKMAPMALRRWLALKTLYPSMSKLLSLSHNLGMLQREKLYQSYGNCHKQIRTSDRNFWSIRNTLRVPMTCRKHSPFSVRDFIQNFYLSLSCACKARP